MRSCLLNERPCKRRVGFLTGTRQQLGKCLRVSMLTEARKQLRDDGELLHIRWQNTLLEIRKSGKRNSSNLCGMVGFLLPLPYSLTPEPTVALTCLALVGWCLIVLMVF